MNAVKDIFSQLVRRRLWPVAVLLAGAIVAVPMLLAKEPVTAPVSSPGKTQAEDVSSAYVALASAEETTERRRVLGYAKDPFEPKALPKRKKAKKAQATPTPTADASVPADDPGTSGGGAPAPSAPPVAPTATPEPKVTIPAYSIKVRFGTTDSEALATKTVQRLAVLPDEESPLVVYRGVENGGKVVVFELTGDVTAEGDGACVPKPEDCQYLKLHAGETEFLTLADTGDAATDAQYQLDIVKIYKKATKVAKTEDDATAAGLAKAASSSLSAKKVTLRRRNRYVFDPTTGTLHRARPGHKVPVSSL
jgi:hypothetical protein